MTVPRLYFKFETKVERHSVVGKKYTCPHLSTLANRLVLLVPLFLHQIVVKALIDTTRHSFLPGHDVVASP